MAVKHESQAQVYRFEKLHKNMSPRWYVRNFHAHGSRMVHISYHDGEHYNSVRLKDDPCTGPANPITIKVDADVSLTSHQEKSTINKSRGDSRESTANTNSIKMVMIGSGCSELSKVEQVLQEVDGDVDAAIEYLIAENEMNENDCSDDQLSSVKEKDSDGGNDGSSECSQEMKHGGTVSTAHVELVHDARTQHDDKVISKDRISLSKSRNKGVNASRASERKCPTRPASRSVRSSRSSASKNKKERRYSKKEPVGLPDVGALCI